MQMEKWEKHWQMLNNSTEINHHSNCHHDHHRHKYKVCYSLSSYAIIMVAIINNYVVLAIQ